MVTRTYLNRPEKTAQAKIRQGDDIWHRMGDLGYFDTQGRLWFCGRKAHRVRTPEGLMFPVLCEIIFNRHPDVNRTALVGVGPAGNQTPVLIVEPEPGRAPSDVLAEQRLKMELLALGAEHAHTQGIRDVTLYPEALPTDVRHNAKIQREKLAAWVAQQPAYRAAAGKGAPTDAKTGTDVTYTGGTKGRPRLGDLLPALAVVAGIVASILLLGRRHNDAENVSHSDERRAEPRGKSR